MLEIEAAGHAVHIEEFAHQEQPSLAAALHGGQVHLPEGHTTSRHKLLPEGSTTGNGVAALAQGLHQAPLVAAAEVGPAQVGSDTVGLEEMEPETTAQARPRPHRAQLPPGLLPPKKTAPDFSGAAKFGVSFFGKFLEA